MSVRAAVAALAAVSVIGVNVTVPQVSSAGQLVDTMAASSINGHLSSIPASNGRGAAQRARNVAGQANAQQQANQVPQDHPVAPSAGAQPAAPAFDDAKPIKGQVYSTDGNVVFDDLVNGQRVVIIVRIAGANKFQLLGFRLHDPSIPRFAPNAPVRVTAKYAAKIKEPQTGSLVHGFDDAVFEQVQASVANGGQASNASAAPKEEKPTFEMALKGWSFRGTAKVGGHATGVFVSEGKVRYANAGDELSAGVTVARIGDGQAKVMVDGKALNVTPW